jgi:drug/metabolite transporter (DMT)-like permease
LFRSRQQLALALRRYWRPGVIGGTLSATAYGMVIWAMSQAPLAMVTALRETSVIAAALIGAMVLREPFGTRRLLAAGLVALGVVLLQFSDQL